MSRGAVLISQRIDALPERDETRDALDVRWGRLLRAAGLVAVPVPSGADVDALASSLSDLRGVLLSGGNDLSSLEDGEINRRRDAVEKALLARCADRPVLGVCRGAQFLAAREGAQLCPVEGHVRARHVLHAAPAPSWAAEHQGREVNSFHRYGLRELAAPWRAVAWADDGVVEAFEHQERPWRGVLWHPERERPFHDADLGLLKDLFG